MRIVLYVLLLALLSSLAHAKDNGYTLLSSELAPWSISNESGIFIDIIREIENRIAGTAELHILPWARAQDMTKHGTSSIIFPMTRIKEREETYIWIAKVVPTRLAFCSTRDIPLDLESARDYSVLVHDHAPPAIYLEGKGFNKLHYMPTGVGTIPKMLEEGRIDVWFSEVNLIRYSVIGTKLEGKLHCGPIIQEKWMYLAGSKNLPPSIVEKYRKTYEDLKEEGIIDQIMLKYLPSNPLSEETN